MKGKSAALASAVARVEIPELGLNGACPELVGLTNGIFIST